MARRAFLPTLPPPPGPPSSPRVSSPPPSGPIGERRSVPPPPVQGIPLAEGIATTAVAQLLDRLSAADDAAFIVSWIEAILATRARLDAPLAVRLLRAYRETGRVERVREVAAQLPPSPSAWNPLDAARLAIERAILATHDGRADHAESELRQASRALASAPKGQSLREQLDFHVTTAQLELKLGRAAQATAALRLAEHVAERIEDGAWRAAASMTLGHLSMRLADPRGAARHYAAALGRAPARGAAAMSAHGNMAIALGSVARFDEARTHAGSALAIAQDLATGWRHADAYDVLAIVEIAADRPLAALQAIDEALVVLGELDQPMLRFQLAQHRTWALAMLDRAQPAAQWLAKTDKLRAEVPALDAVDVQDLLSTRARTLEACGQVREALDQALPFVDRLPEAFVTGNLNLVVGRCALALGDEATARAAVERAALSGDKHGWVFPDRAASAALFALARRSGDSRVVRWAERIEALETNSPPPAAGPLSLRGVLPVRMPSASSPYLESPEALDQLPDPPVQGEALMYVTTPLGVARVPAADLKRHLGDATLVVDTMAHALRVFDREVSLERRRALEPLVVQLLRRAREGLSAEEILRAAGGPGPESADAEHRVRVLISRVRDLLGDPASIERVRDAGEYGRTRYRLAPNVKFALIEPLFNPTGQ